MSVVAFKMNWHHSCLWGNESPHYSTYFPETSGKREEINKISKPLSTLMVHFKQSKLNGIQFGVCLFFICKVWLIIITSSWDCGEDEVTDICKVF